MDIFKISDVYGIIAAMLGLVFLYLILNNSGSATSIVGSVDNAANSTLKTLQARA